MNLKRKCEVCGSRDHYAWDPAWGCIGYLSRKVMRLKMLNNRLRKKLKMKTYAN